ncbi:MAG: Uncharacterized protein FD145_1403 [Candidatus Saganbacteria bacterium]|uniref:Uncharacterized protein n=1 Tax=Candidatus Saganbacteria bacterium TaxID=2575572 RepID=A0A833KZY5_UNCSA|nr:MAG: Uncharacterized protein FD145_1403 [Candidatus Saganbacteria bacterium]
MPINIDYISNKNGEFDLTLIDLLFVKNFKGGNATINEKASIVNAKLKAYSNFLVGINREFGKKQLRDLTTEQLESIKTHAKTFLSLTTDENTSIDGLKSSYASALLHFYFPNLIPILDRRVLNGAKISVEKNSQGQVIDIQKHYPELIDKFYKYLKVYPEKSLRDYDKECFIKSIK